MLLLVVEADFDQRAQPGQDIFTGALIMVYNLVRTARGDVPADERKRTLAW